MTALDVAALERASAPAVELLGLRTVRASGAGSAVSGFDAFGRVYLSAAVAEFQRGSRSDSVTLTVEQSGDGLSWSTAATFEFTSDDVQFATIDAPADQLRVSWTFAGRLRSCRIVGVKATAGSLDSVSGGGGGSLPAEWAVANGKLTITPTASGAPETVHWLGEAATLTIDGQDDINGSVIYSAVAADGTGNTLLVEQTTLDVSEALDVTVSGTHITVILATDSDGLTTSTAAQVVAAVNADAQANLLVVASPGGTGAGIPGQDDGRLTGGLTGGVASVRPRAIGLFMKLASSAVLVPTNGAFIPWDTPVFDTDGFWDPSSVNGEFVIPAGLGGLYLLEAALYVAGAAADNPDLDRPLAVFHEPSDSCDIQFYRKTPDSNSAFDPNWWYGSGAFTRPLDDGDVVGVVMGGTTSNAQNKINLLGGNSQSMVTLTRLSDLPPGYVSPF